MKIAIDSRGATLYHGTGIGTYTNNLLSELLSVPSVNEYILFCCGKFNSKFNTPNSNIVYSSGKHGGFYERCYIPHKLEDMKIDLYHIPQNGIGFEFTSTIPTIVTIHDLIPYLMPETVGKGYLERFLRDIPNIIQNSAGILTVSECSKKDILKYFSFYPEDKIFVTPLATNANYKPLNKLKCKQFINKKYNFEGPYILYLGGFSARKNVLGLIKAFSKIYKDLNCQYKLLIGGSLKDEGKELFKFVNDSNLEDKIIFCGYVEDEILPTIYNGCDTFVYPSYYEGFGLPPLEAMSCGVPVITSNISSIPEVTGNNAILINPHSEYELSNELVNVLNNDNIKRSLCQNGYKRSLEFNWKKTALSTLDAYNKISNFI
ncbi:MAG: glycosyltransferase family 4 protein [Clostridium butyricum]|nr:glycosyltransferase family 4 protein [Clostridium butyricum]